MVDDATQATDQDEAAIAQEGFRQAAARVQRTAKRRPQEEELTPPTFKEPKEGENFFDQFDPQTAKIGLTERAHLNAVDGFYRGTLAGSSRLAAMASRIRDPDKPDATPEEKKSKQRMRDEYTDITANLARYDTMNHWGTSTEGAFALLGTLGGSMLSPESWVGAAAKGGSLLARTGKAALQQAAISGASDPVVQGLNIQAGVESNYDPVKTIMAGSMGAVIGGGLHAAGELIGQGVLRLTKRWLGTEDHEFLAADQHSFQQDAEQAAAEAIEAPNAAGEAQAIEPSPAAEAQAVERPGEAEAATGAAAEAPPSPTEAAIERRLTEGADFVPPPEAPPPPKVEAGKALSPEAEQAATIVREADKPSISLIQRKMKLGFEAANKLMNELEEGGVVTARDKNGLREVIKTPEEEAAAAKAAEAAPEKPKAEEIPESEIKTTEVKPKRVVKRDESKMSVLQFLSTRGGLRPTPELVTAFGGKNPFIPGFGRLLRKNGMTMDKALEAAIEGKFLPPRAEAAVESAERQTGHNKLLDLIDEESRGRKQYAMGMEPEAKPQDVAQRQYEIEQRAKELLDNVELDERTRADVERKITEIMEKEGETNAENALERVILEAADRHDAAERNAATGDIPGWDVDESGAAFEGGGRFAEEKPGTSETSRVPSVEATAIGDQFIIPGGEHSVRQLAAAREAAGHGRIVGKKGQKEEAGPLFAPGETEEDLLFTRQAGAPARPAGGVQPPPPRDVAVRSLQQQSGDLAAALDIPLRTGRVESGAVGQFSQRSGVARVEDIADFAVVSHELGHALEAKAGTPLTQITINHDIELSKLVPNASQLDPAVRIKEGFAEYMRDFMNNPAYAASQSPGFTNDFKNFMQQNYPDIWKTLVDSADAFRAYRDAPSENAIHAVIRSRSEHPEGIRGVIKRLRENGFFPTIKSVMENIYESVWDENADMTRVVKDLTRSIRNQTGRSVDLKAADNPAILIRFFRRTMQTATHDLMDGVRPYHGVTPEGPSLSDALALATGSPTVWGKWQDGPTSLFVDYLTARMGLTAWDRFHKGEIPNPPVPFSRGDAVQAMAQIEAQMPNFRKASDMVHEWSLRLLQKQFDAGLLSQEVLLQARQQPFYVPLFRDMSEKPAAGRVGGGAAPAGPGMTDLIKRMRGSQRDIINPLEALMAKAFLTARTIQHNDIIRSLVNISKKAGVEGGKYAEELPAHEARKYTFDLQEAVERLGKEQGIDPLHIQDLASSLTDVFGEDPLVGSFFRMEPTAPRGEPIVFYRDGGQLKAVRVMNKEEGRGIYELLTQMPAQVTDWWVQVIGTAASVKRAGITFNPTFALSNYVRDQFATAILYRGYVPIYSGLTGIHQELTQGEHAALYSYAGGVAGGALTGAVERAAEADINAMARRGYSITRVPTFKGALETVSITEAGTRNSIFKNVYEAKRAQGLSPYEAMWEAAFQAQDILDFGRHGSRTQTIARMLPFLNAHIQGLDKARRTMIEPILDKVRDGSIRATSGDNEAFNNAIASWAKAGGLGAVAGAMYAAVAWESEAYRDAGPALKGTHVVVPLGDKIVVIPKPFELAMGFTLGEYAYAKWAKDDARAAGQFMEATWQAVAPPNPLTDIPILGTVSQLSLGRSYFTGQDIVPEELQGREPSEQVTSRTSSLAKHIGKLINVSPIKVDFAIGDMFGTWGRDAMTLSSAVDQDTPAHNWEDRVFTRRFIKDPARTSDVTTRYWDFMRRSTGKYNQDLQTYQMYVDRGRDDQAREYMGKLPKNERSFLIVNKAANEDGKPAFDADEKRVHPLQRSYNAVTVLNGLRKEINEDSVRRTEDQTDVKLNPIQRRDLLDATRELGQMEMRNGLVIMQEPGYKGRPLMDVNVPMERIRRISPVMADEIANRYATASVYTTKAIAAAWPAYRDELVKNGSQADIGSIAFDVKGEGYEFGADRLRKPAKRRIVVEPGQFGLGR